MTESTSLTHVERSADAPGIGQNGKRRMESYTFIRKNAYSMLQEIRITLYFKLTSAGHEKNLSSLVVPGIVEANEPERRKLLEKLAERGVNDPPRETRSRRKGWKRRKQCLFRRHHFAASPSARRPDTRSNGSLTRSRHAASRRGTGEEDQYHG